MNRENIGLYWTQIIIDTYVHNRNSCLHFIISLLSLSDSWVCSDLEASQPTN